MEKGNYPLSNEWSFYIHLHHTDDWSYESYTKIIDLAYAEDAILLSDEINYDFIKKSMFFLMKKNIKPMWEDENNRNGGCFSFKIINKNIEKIWKEVFYTLIGNGLISGEKNKNINGITLSPKKNFCILKVWMKDCNNIDPDIFVNIKGMSKEGCIFKKHQAES